MGDKLPERVPSGVCTDKTGFDKDARLYTRMEVMGTMYSARMRRRERVINVNLGWVGISAAQKPGGRIRLDKFQKSFILCP